MGRIKQKPKSVSRWTTDFVRKPRLTALEIEITSKTKSEIENENVQHDLTVLKKSENMMAKFIG